MTKSKRTKPRKGMTAAHYASGKRKLKIAFILILEAALVILLAIAFLPFFR